MKYIISISLFTFGCDPYCYIWSPSPTREDIVTCNQVRAGTDSSYVAENKFQDCIQSLGYNKVEWECPK